MSEPKKPKADMRRKICAYCGNPAWWKPGTPRPVKRCDCKYRYMRMGASAVSLHNTSRHTTVKQMRVEIEKHLANMVQEAHVAFIFSVTRLDAESIAKADIKRGGEA